MTRDEQKADLIKKSLIIVDKLADLDVEDKNDIDDFVELIDKAKKIKRDTLWRLE